MLMQCPYDDCPYETDKQADLDDHIAYMIMMQDDDHAESKLKDRH